MAALLLVSLAAACSGGEAGPGASTTAPPTTAAPTTTITTTSIPPTTTTTSTTAPPTTTTTSTTTTTTTAPPSTTTTTTRPELRRQPTADDPLRVWVIGDSLAGGPGYSLGARGRATGVITTSVHGEGGTGLVRFDVFDWPAYVAAERPPGSLDLIVVLMGANDGQAMLPAQGGAQFGTEEWDRAYAALVDALLDQLLEFSSRVYWVGPPIMADPGYDSTIRRINRILRQRAALRLEVRYIDAYTLLSRRGGYTTEFPGQGGEPIRVRSEDGSHFSPAGADRLARRLMEVITAELLEAPPTGG